MEFFNQVSLGDCREAIYLDDDDRRSMLQGGEQAMDRFDAEVLAYCFIENYFQMCCTRGPEKSGQKIREKSGADHALKVIKSQARGAILKIDDPIFWNISSACPVRHARAWTWRAASAASSLSGLPGRLVIACWTTVTIPDLIAVKTWSVPYLVPYLPYLKIFGALPRHYSSCGNEITRKTGNGKFK